MVSVLLIAYGNSSRQDDGVAFHIVNRLRQVCGQALVCDDDDDESPNEEASCPLTIRRVQQLGPELSEVLAQYDVVIFIDAHVEGSGWEAVHWGQVQPAYRSGMVTHHLLPAALLALCQSLYGRMPKSYILSVLGTDFDFGEELSDGTSALADQAVWRLVEFLRDEGIIAADQPGAAPS